MPSPPGQSPAHSQGPVRQEPEPGVAVHSGGGCCSEWRSGHASTLPLTGCATLGKLLDLSGPQFPSEPST